VGYSTAAKNAMLNTLGGLVTHISLHSGDPGASGENELSGGSPAYARRPIAWSAADGGEIVGDSTYQFNVPAGATVAHVGFWGAAEGGTFYGSDALYAEMFDGQGLYPLTLVVADLNG